MLDNDQLLNERFYSPIPAGMESFEGVDLSKYVCIFGGHICKDISSVEWLIIGEKNFLPLEKGEFNGITLYRERQKFFAAECKEFGVEDREYIWIPKQFHRLFTGGKQVAQYPDFKKSRPNSIKPWLARERSK